MNFEDLKVTGVNQVSTIDSLEAPLFKIEVERNSSTIEPEDNQLIIFVDENDSTNPTDNLRRYVYDLSKPLKYVEGVSDKFVLEIKPQKNDVVLVAKVERKLEQTDTSFEVLTEIHEEVLESFPICLFEGTNYIYTNYNNADISVVYPKNCDLTKLFLTNSIYYNHKIKNDGEFSLDDIYFKDAFTKSGDKLDCEVDNINVSSITSKNNNFNLDEEGNLIVNSITTRENNNSNINFDSVYPIGSIYMTINTINPSTLFGGVWEQIKDRFLLGAGDNYAVGSIGGEATHLLTTGEMPKHNHTWSQSSCTNPGNHSHVVGADKDGGGGSNRYTVHIKNGSTTNGQQYSPSSGSAGGHTHTVKGTISEVGENKSHNNMPPYMTVFIWKRIS